MSETNSQPDPTPIDTDSAVHPSSVDDANPGGENADNPTTVTTENSVDKTADKTKQKRIVMWLLVALFATIVLCCCAGFGFFWFMGKSTERPERTTVTVNETKNESSDSTGKTSVHSKKEGSKTASYKKTSEHRSGLGTRKFMCHNVDISFDAPSDWYKQEESQPGTEVCFVSKESLETNTQFSTGLSINRVSDVRDRSGETASEYAKDMIDRIADKYTGTAMQDDVNGYKVYSTVVNVDDQITPIRVRYVAFGSDVSDEAYLIWFESPQTKWDDMWSTAGQTIFATFELGGEALPL